jgi:hypothetical protein
MPDNPLARSADSLWDLSALYARRHSASALQGPIPTYTMWGPASSSSVVDGNTLNATGSTAQEQQQQIAAENAPLRLIFGRAPIGAQIADLLSYNGNMVVIAVWGQGPVNLVESVYLSNVAPPAGVTVTNYDGTQVTADPTLVAAYAAQTVPVVYTDILPGVCYSVLVIPPGVTTGFPQITAMIQGLKLFDHRTGLTAYSENAAVVIGNLQTNATWGAGDAVDWSSVDAVANDCDAMVGGTDVRRSIGLVVDTAQDIGVWFETLRAYAGCFLYRNNGVLTLASDRPTSSSFTFTESATANCRISNIKRRSKRDAPTVVAVRWMDISIVPARDTIAYAYAAGAREGTIPWKIREVSMPGITRSSYATREATEQLNKLQLTDLTFDIAGQDEALAVTVGDVVTATANIGITAREMRVIASQMPSLGRPIFGCEGYDPAVYSDSVAVGPSVSDTSLPDPASITAPTNLVVTETVYFEGSGDSALAGGMNYKSRFDCTWDAPTGQFPILYRVEVWDGALAIRNELVSDTAYSSPSIEQGKTYTIKVFSRNSVFECPTPASTTQVAQGKLLPPGPVPSCTGRELGGNVLLAWTSAIDIDVMRYEWRYFPNGTGTWETATFIDRVDGLTATFQGLPVGTHRFYVRAIDSVGKYSTSDCTVDIVITSDPNAILQDKTFISPTLTNCISIQPIEGVWKPRWVTSFSAATWDATFPSTFDSYTNPIDSYHSSGTSTWQGEPWDLGSTISGSWTLTPNVTQVAAPVSYYLETSSDGVTYTRQPGISWQGSTRFVRPVIEGTTTGAFQVDSPPEIHLAALAKHESGTATTSASVATLIQLANKYASRLNVQATAINQVGGTVTSRDAIVDRVLLSVNGPGLCLHWTLGTYTSALLRQISTVGRVIASGDYLEYDVFIETSSPSPSSTSDGGFRVAFTDASVTVGDTDADGFDITTPATGFDALARGIWKSRKISLSPYVGKTTNSWRIVGSSQAVGDHSILLRNVRITDGAGTDRLVVWSSGEPTSNTTSGSGGQTNIQCGPANSFNLYVFTTSTGAQVASDAAWDFDGF